MRLSKVLSIMVVSIATAIVILAIGIATFAFLSSRNGQHNFPPTQGQQVKSPIGSAILFSKNSGASSFLYRQDGPIAKPVRLTTTSRGIESEPSFSHDGKFIVYSFASSADSKSSVWVAGVEGQNPHAVSGDDQDALHPVFSPEDSKIYYCASSFTGHHSPIARPARHEWDIFAIPVQSGNVAAGSSPAQITHQSFYDLYSLDVAADGLNPGGTKLLISTTGYPIGALIEEFHSANLRNEIFQPHVPSEPSLGPAFGEARFTQDGMGIVFLAATDGSDGQYDYNVYSMSEVTGGEIKRLTNLKGMTKELRIQPNGKATFVNSGAVYLIDLSTQKVELL